MGAFEQAWRLLKEDAGQTQYLLETKEGRGYGIFDTIEGAERYMRMVVGDGEAEGKDLVIREINSNQYPHATRNPPSEEPPVRTGDILNLGATRPFDPEIDSHEKFIGE